MSEITERTLYKYICSLLESKGWKCYPETSSKGKFPDIIIERNGTRLVSEIKIDTEVKLSEAIADAYQKALSLQTPNMMALVFPSNIREIPPPVLQTMYPKLQVNMALIMTE